MRHLHYLAYFIMLIGLFLIVGITMAQDGEESPPSATRMHPSFALLDTTGQNVLESGAALSTEKTCGQCHDTIFISQHSQHARVSLNSTEQWNPLLYRYITAEDDLEADLTVEAYISQLGGRHVGGGNNSLVETNCFLCHTARPDNTARLAALQAGQFDWANSATLLMAGIVSQDEEGVFSWNREAFDAAGLLKRDFITLQDPSSENCSQCHGQVHLNNQVPLEAQTCDSTEWTTYTTGQIFASQRIAASALNLENKESLSRSWDIHAERLVGCVDCHYALNNPTYYKTVSEDHPEHLIFDPRRLDISEYLYRPSHNLASGSVLAEAGALVQNEGAQACEACHSLEDNHDWLPYKDRHIEVLACESCHIPQMNAPALQSVDWTSLQADASPRIECRGVEPTSGLIEGYQPVLLQSATTYGNSRLAPYNLVSTWYWVYGETGLPVPMAQLQTAWFEGENYFGDVLDLFDANADGQLDETELLLDTDAKEALIADRLSAQGLTNPRIVGQVLPFALNHGVTSGDWATQDCLDCHQRESQVSASLVLADASPGGVLPMLATNMEGQVIQSDQGELRYEPAYLENDLYIFGHNRIGWINWLGILIFFGTFAGVMVHGGLRYASARQHIPTEPHLKSVYMYSVYERQWHWLQTALIFLLIFTGLVIHQPAEFKFFSFRYVVQIHNISAALLLINAVLAAFYHLASGEIQQFLPRPYGFFDQAFTQAKYYLWGIFKGAPHPYEKTPTHKLNPLQQLTYLALLNVLLPLQIITGALMWGQERFPAFSETFGGLPYLAPVHTLVAWLFASFIVLHVYLTTTGHQPMANLKAMMMGWDEIESPQEQTGGLS